MNNSRDEFNLSYYDDDIYGLYKPGRAYESEAEAIKAKREARLKSKEKSEAIINNLLHIALWALFCLSAFLRYSGVLEYSGSYVIKYLLMPLFIINYVLYQVVLVIDICMMYSRYGKVSLLFTGFLITPVYPFFRNMVRGKSKTVPIIWFILFVILLYPFLNYLKINGILRFTLWKSLI